MRTTVTIDDHLLEQAKLLAVRRATTVGSVLEDGLRLLLERTERARSAAVVLPTFGGTGVRPGVDLDDRHAVMDLLDLEDEEDDGLASR